MSQSNATMSYKTNLIMINIKDGRDTSGINKIIGTSSFYVAANPNGFPFSPPHRIAMTTP